MSPAHLVLYSSEIATIIDCLLSSAHFDPVSQIDHFGLVLKLQTALPSPPSLISLKAV